MVEVSHLITSTVTLTDITVLCPGKFGNTSLGLLRDEASVSIIVERLHSWILPREFNREGLGLLCEPHVTQCLLVMPSML